MADPIQTALIGVGNIGQRYFEHLRRTPGFELSVVADVLPERLFYVLDQGFDHVMDDGLAAITHHAVEAVIIATPPAAHRCLASAALVAGRHVLVEKPLAVNSGEATGLLEQVRDATGTLSVAFSQRCNVALQRLRERLHAGTLGRIVEVGISARVDRDPRLGGWLFDTAQGGGAVLESSVHAIDLVRWLTGQEFVRVAAETDVRAGAAGTYEHLAAVVARLSGGTLARFNVSFGCAPPRTLSAQLAILGELDDAYLDLGVPLLRKSSPGSATNAEELLRHDHEIGSFARQLQHWRRVIRDGARPAADIADGVAALVVAEAILRAARTHRAVTLKEPM